MDGGTNRPEEILFLELLPKMKEEEKGKEGKIAFPHTWWSLVSVPYGAAAQKRRKSKAHAIREGKSNNNNNDKSLNNSHFLST